MTKIQKLLYLAYGYFLATENRVISKEQPKAWPYGPVFPRVHKKVKLNKIKPLSDECFNDISKDSHLTEKLISIIEKYSKFSASKLSDWSHEKNGPWDKTTKLENFKWGITEIPEEYISNYFSNLSV